MKALIIPTTILLLFVLVRCGDLAISAAIAKSVIRTVCYGLVALLALIALLVMFVA